jgi:hypothetical protein
MGIAIASERDLPLGRVADLAYFDQAPHGAE